MLTDLLGYFAATCNKSGSFFGLPHWYEYLNPHDVATNVNGKAVSNCEVDFDMSKIPLVGLALVDILLRVAALVAVGYIIYGGIQFIIAQGETDKTKKARQTIINALVGLVIAILATSIVSFVGTQIGKP